MSKYRKSIGIIGQIAILFALGILTIGLIAFFTQQVRYDSNIKSETEAKSERIAREAADAVKEYPAYNWMISYWYKHSDQLDIEYDVDYRTGKETERKARELNEKYPKLQLKYATEDEIRDLDEEDQKKYAEVTYSWLITRLNQIKRVNDVDYLFCVIPYDSFHRQTFIFSAASPGAVRGTEYDQTYPLGHRVEILEESQKESMLAAQQNEVHIGSAGNYVDCYYFLGKMGEWPVLIGITYDVSALSKEIISKTKRSTLFAGVYQLLLAIMCMLLLYRFVLKPLKKVMDNIRMYKENKDSKVVGKNLSTIVSQNEIGQLASDVADLTREMDDYIEEITHITAEKERIGAELTVANRIQESMLPTIFPAFPDRKDFDIYASMDPAKEVGGDFYDFFLVDEDHVCLVIADVSGKGVPAALQMMASKIIIANIAKMGLPPSAILKETNNIMCENNKEDMFVTVWVGIMEVSTGKLTASNAGHEYPIIKSADGHYEMLKDKHGFVIGAMEDVEYRDYEIQLEPGSGFFVYTDGVAEATDKDNNMFGVERLIEILNAEPDADPKKTLENVRKGVDRFVGGAEQFDDLTMLCVTYNGKNRDGEKENG